LSWQPTAAGDINVDAGSPAMAERVAPLTRENYPVPKTGFIQERTLLGNIH